MIGKIKKQLKSVVCVLLSIVILLGLFPVYAFASSGDPLCGLEEHVHSDECMEAVQVCSLAEDEYHTHDDECFSKELVCGLPEHEHTDECFADASAGEESQDESSSTNDADNNEIDDASP